MLDHYVQALALLARAVPGRAEIQELGRMLRRDDDIVRRDVPVYDPFGMNHVQRFHQRQKKLVCFLYRQAAAFRGHIFVQRHAFHILHGEIGCAVLLKVAVDPDDMLVPDECGKRLRFFKKTFLAESEVFFPVSGVGRHHVRPERPARELRGKILLDGHTLLALIIQGDICDAEAALTQDPSDYVSAVQNGTRAEG